MARGARIAAVVAADTTQAAADAARRRRDPGWLRFDRPGPSGSAAAQRAGGADPPVITGVGRGPTRLAAPNGAHGRVSDGDVGGSSCGSGVQHVVAELRHEVVID